MEKVFSLSEKINAHVTYVNPISPGSEIYRIIFEIYTDPSHPNHMLKEYEIWVSETFIEDYLHLTKSSSEDDMVNFAKGYLIDRFKLGGNTVPPEGGVYITNTTGEIKGDPRTFSLKSRDNKRLVRTSLMIPTETLDWLRDQKLQKRVDMGESIRRAVDEYKLKTSKRSNV